jgi:YHS domain-containing protein
MKTIKTILLALIATSIISSCTQKPKSEATAEKTASVSLASDADPVCNMNIKGIQADTTLHNGQVYGFCSDACKKSFKENPDQYLAKK